MNNSICLLQYTNAFDFMSVSDLDDTVQAQTTGGLIQGLRYDDYAVFYGIPFAAPPVGPARWQPPTDPESWQPKVLDARYPQFGCPQNCELPPGTCPTNTSENCLYLNVFVPISALPLGPNDATRPVMAFLPGGRFEQGAAATVLYNARTMVNSSDAIVVTINYRLGVLGFLITDEFSGNYGFLDQRQALMWIQNNIAYFGGDRTRVTLCGQSAGATSIAAHITSPLSFGLFHQAISESNPYLLDLKTREIETKNSMNFAKAVGCPTADASCLYQLTPEEIIQGQIKAQNEIDILIPLALFLPWTPTVDGTEIFDQPINLIKQGKFYEIPMIVGTCMEEALLFIYQAANKSISKFEYEIGMDGLFLNLDDAKQVIAQYPPISGDNRPVLSVIGTDYIFVCPNRNMTRYLSRSETIYTYQFQHVLSFDAWGPLYPNCVGHVCHGSELPFVFNSASLGGYTFTPDEQTLAYAMNNYWMNFVVNGNPNIGLPVPTQWPTFNETGDQTLIFQAPTPYVESGLLSQKCDFWDSMGYDNPVR
ncbi:putative cholinesterase [Heterostelium album PN500]|uniref:Carboxylic ester hydrolase n=1 Tax=Heterostelium pallidum (strain ATCC 26659 / Pp 5 / PN500) TaxID=670386 RepID=D3BMM2_HETP5|nr:putative cholinesterase [Heterostelium album PN500]EFA77234.1 putative cholinesterase [Heterostelium album PN500]|eukprot:XP_020429363.1 putative cholinesterase [Heterostelium album PN500]